MRMRVALDEAGPPQETVMTLGSFDGLHLGHR
ncbi:TPA: riboflavin biosynthesis protein RibF, partial [Candidatus Bipolaricaulota bacterium]|nr:riboflavin biosynthesis protein RibF [Candidatus Bipolaricaulota bacterium]